MTKFTIKNAAIAGVALAGMSATTVMAYGPLYVHDYATGSPYRWDVSEPVQVYTDGGNFASGTVWVYVETPETCNEAGGWQCGYSEELYVEFTNEQGVARVAEALASWSSVPTSSFQAEIGGTFADLGIGGADGDITGAADEFAIPGDFASAHEIVGTDNGGGIHVMFDETGELLANVFGAPYGVLGIASPEWADEESGVITEGWAAMGGAGTYHNDTDLAQMAGVITHELGHSLNLAHTQTNGHVVFYGVDAPVSVGPISCTANNFGGTEYRLPFPQDAGPQTDDMAVMYPFVDVDPNSYYGATGAAQATVDTREDFAAISFLYPADSFQASTGSISGTVTYPFSNDGIIGLNIVARNLADPYGDAISVMTGDWNDGEADAAQGVGEFTLHGLTPGADYVVHVESIFRGGFPTPISSLPGPAEYFNGSRETDDATRDDACDAEAVVVTAGNVLNGIDIQINGVKRAPQLVINPAPNADQITENGRSMGGTVAAQYGDALSWTYNESSGEHTLWPLAGLGLSENGSIIGGAAIVDNTYVPVRILPGQKAQLIEMPAEMTACDQGSGVLDAYSHYAISPDGSTIGGFLWDCHNPDNPYQYAVHAATWNDRSGWSVLSDEGTGIYSRVNSVSNNGVAAGWITGPYGNRLGSVWNNGERIDIQTLDPDVIEVGEAYAVSSNGTLVVGESAYNSNNEPRGWVYNVVDHEITTVDIVEPCDPFDWFCFGPRAFRPVDVADDGTLVGGIGSPASIAMMVNDVVGEVKLHEFLRAQGVMNADDLSVGSLALKASNNGRHIIGWTAVEGEVVSFRLTLDQLWVCRNGKSMQVGYPQAVASQLKNGAELGMCEQDLPLQFKSNF